MGFSGKDRVLLYKAEKNRNKARDLILLSALVVSICITSCIISLIYAKYSVDKRYYERMAGKTLSITIENASQENQERLEALDYVDSTWQEYENAALFLEGLRYASCITTDAKSFRHLYLPTMTGLEGEFPGTEKEILLSDKALRRLGIENPVPGMEIELDFAWTQIKYSKFTGKQDFILSGFYQSGEEDGDLSLAFLSPERMEAAGLSKWPCNLSIEVKKPWQSKENLQSCLSEDVTLEEGQRLICDDSASYRALEATGGNIYLGYFLLLFILFCAYLVLYNVLSISSLKDAPNYQLLRAIGATRKQIRAVVFKRMGTLWLKGAAVSACICLPLQYLLLPALEALFYKGQMGARESGLFSLKIFSAMTLLSGIVLFLSTALVYRSLSGEASPQKNLYYSGGILSSKGRLFKAVKENRLLFRLAISRVFRSKRKLLLSLFLLFLGCELALLGTVVISGMDKMKKLRENPDFRVEVPWNTILYQMEHAVEEEDVERMRANSLGSLKDTLRNLATDIKAEKVAWVLEASDAGMKNLQILEGKMPPILLTVDDDYRQAFLKYAEKNLLPIDEEAFRQGKGVLILHENSSAAKRADELYRSGESPFLSLASIPALGTAVETLPSYQVHILGFADMNAEDFPFLPLPWQRKGNIYLLVGEELFASLQEHLKTQYVGAQIRVKAEDRDEAEYKINRWVKECNKNLRLESGNSQIEQFIYKSKKDSMRRMASYIFAGKLSVYTLSALLVFLGLAVYLITSLTNALVYKEESSLLKAIGFTQRSLRKLLFYESYLYITSLVLLWMTVGNLLLLPLVKVCSFYEDFSYSYPLWLVAVMLLGLVLIAAIVPCIQKAGSKD